MVITWVTRLIMALVGALTARPAAALVVGVIQPYTNNVDVLATSAAADFTAPTWTGYVDQTIVLSAAFSEDASHGFVAIGNTTWQMGSSSDPSTTVVGCIIKDGSGNLLAGGKLPAPITLLNNTQAFVLSGKLSVGANGVGGQWVTIT